MRIKKPAFAGALLFANESSCRSERAASCRRRANVAWKNTSSGRAFNGRVDSAGFNAGVINNRRSS
jgi:hypothetical protein